jgi:hypothetical protein
MATPMKRPDGLHVHVPLRTAIGDYLVVIGSRTDEG